MHILHQFYWFTRFFIRSGGWLALIPLSIGIAATLQSATLLLQSRALADHGLTATAQVLDKRVIAPRNTGNSSTDSGTYSYYIDYSFTPAGADAPLRTEDDVHRSFYQSVQVGQQFSLRYLPEDPQIQSLYDGNLERWSQSGQAVGLGASVIGFLVIWWFYVPAMRAYRARRSVSGTTETTDIIETYVTLCTVWPPLFNRMQFQMQDPDTQKATFHKTFARPFWAYSGLKRGSKIHVVQTSQGPYWRDDLFL